MHLDYKSENTFDSAKKLQWLKLEMQMLTENSSEKTVQSQSKSRGRGYLQLGQSFLITIIMRG
jgi:alpha-L-fucosidase